MISVRGSLRRQKIGYTKLQRMWPQKDHIAQFSNNKNLTHYESCNNNKKMVTKTLPPPTSPQISEKSGQRTQIKDRNQLVVVKSSNKKEKRIYIAQSGKLGH